VYEISTGTGEGEWGGRRGYNGSSNARKRSKAGRGMKVKKGGSSTALALLTIRELLCFESDRRWERGGDHLPCVVSPTLLGWVVPPSLLYRGPSGN